METSILNSLSFVYLFPFVKAMTIFFSLQFTIFTVYSESKTLLKIKLYAIVISAEKNVIVKV